jgi:steroid delta-isomerase-like uncharacterized protein
MSPRRTLAIRALNLVVGLSVLVVTLGGATPALAVEAEMDEAATNKEVMRQFVAAMNARDLDALDELVAADVMRHSPSTPGVEVSNLEQFKEFLRQDFAGVPDAVQTVRWMVAEGDKVAVWANYSGVQSGSMGPFPASNKRVDLDFAGVLRFEDGKIVEIRVVWDNLSMLAALGHLPPPGSAQP